MTIVQRVVNPYQDDVLIDGNELSIPLTRVLRKVASEPRLSPLISCRATSLTKVVDSTEASFMVTEGFFKCLVDS